MDQESRYAIYLIPAAEDLSRWGNGIVGRDPNSGRALVQPVLPSIQEDHFRELTKAPRWYGFHATLKPPFPLGEGKKEADLINSLQEFSGQQQAFQCRLGVNEIAGFLALTPAEASPLLNQLANACVMHFDSFRAPLSPLDRERRNPTALTVRQRQYLDTWGYPYVLEEFRFHMTLTGRIQDPSTKHRVREALSRSYVENVNPETEISKIAVFKQTTRGHPFMNCASFHLFS